MFLGSLFRKQYARSSRLKKIQDGKKIRSGILSDSLDPDQADLGSNCLQILSSADQLQAQTLGILHNLCNLNIVADNMFQV